jgi:hypothetical protein
MTDASKKMVLAAMISAGVVAVAALSDLVIGIPFAGKETMTFDIILLVSAAIVGYLAWDAFKDLR